MTPADDVKSMGPRPRRSPKAIVACLAALAIFTAVDLWAKNLAQASLSRAPLAPPSEVCVPDDSGRVFMQRLQTRPVVVVPNYLELRYAENCGAAFGVLDRGPAWMRLALFGPAALAATLGLLWLFVSGYGGRLFAISVPLIASGALGNLIDRFRLGYVIDFVRFHIQESFVWPTFNIADSTITVGVALLLIEGLLSPRTAAPPQPVAPQAATNPSPDLKTPR
jgi:signal peptidase II